MRLDEFLIDTLISNTQQMRARRLRRLGLMGEDGAAAAAAGPTTAPSTPTPIIDNFTATISAAQASASEDLPSRSVSQKNNLSPESAAEGNDRKLKQQKIETDPIEDIAFNNNIGQESSIDTKIGSQSLTQRSRLLNEIEKQRIENRLNQNVKEACNIALPVKSVTQMEVTESPMKTAQSTSVETMEVDELTPPTETVKIIAVESQLTEAQKQREAEICMSRILDARWMDACEGKTVVSTELWDFYKEEMADCEMPIDFEDWSFQVITDIVAQYFDGQIIDFKVTKSPELSLSPSTSAMDTSEPSCSAPTMKPHNLPAHGALTYLTQAFARCWLETGFYSNAKNSNKFGTSVLDMIDTVHRLLVQSSRLLLDGTIADTDGNFNPQKSVLLKLLYEEVIPLDFLCLLVGDTYLHPTSFRIIFSAVAENLFIDMQSRTTGKTIDMASIKILQQLIDITVTPGNIRPIANLIVALPNFVPTLSTLTHGREMVKVSYLGPFFSMSVFAEENPKLAEDIDENWEVTFGKSLQMVRYIHLFFSTIL